VDRRFPWEVVSVSNEELLGHVVETWAAEPCSTTLMSAAGSGRGAVDLHEWGVCQRGLPSSPALRP
jgi:hypothetical protein